MTLFVMCGLPGSGKSTFAKKLAKETHSIIVCPDTIRAELTGSEEDQSMNSKVFDIAYERATKALTKGDVIFDATNTNERFRKVLLDNVKADKTVAVVVKTDLDECLKRNALRSRKVPEEVIRRMYDSFDYPNRSEGFDDIMEV